MVVRVLLRVLPVLIGAIGAAVLAASQVGVMTLTSAQALACIAGVGAAAIVGPFLPDLTEARILRRQRDVSVSLRQAIAFVIDDCHASWKGVGAHFFLVKRWPRIAFTGKPPFLHVEGQLGDIGHERFDVLSYPSKFKFTKNKGVVGACWARGQNSFLDLVAHFQPHQPLTKEGWGQLGAAVTLGLSWSEYEATHGIEVIAAYVARNKSGKVVGVVSIEAVRWTADDPPVPTLDGLEGSQAGRYIGHLGDTIVRDLGR